MFQNHPSLKFIIINTVILEVSFIFAPYIVYIFEIFRVEFIHQRKSIPLILYAMTMILIVFETTIVDNFSVWFIKNLRIFMIIYSFAIHFIIFPSSVIITSVWMYKLTLAMSQASSLLSMILTTIRIFLLNYLNLAF